MPLADRWLYFDRDYDAFVPYRYDRSISTTNLSIWLEAGKDRYRLQLPVEPQTCIYINNRLYFVYERKDTVSIDLKPFLHPRRQPRIFLTLFHPQGQLYPRQAVLVNSNYEVPAAATQKPAVMPRPRKPWLPTSYAQMYLLFLAGLYVMIRTAAPRAFTTLFSASDYLEGELDDYVQAERRVFSNFGLAVMIANALTISFVIYLLTAGAPQLESLSQPLLKATSRLGRLAILVNFVLLGLAYFVFKYFLLSFAGFVFHIRRISTAHFFEFIRSSTLLAMSLLAVVLLGPVGGWFSTAGSLYLMQVAIIGFFLFRMVKIILLLRQLRGYRPLYLFSYLCATELVLLIYVSRLTLKGLS